MVDLLEWGWKIGAALGGVAGTVVMLLFAWGRWSADRQYVTREEFAAWRTDHGEEHDEVEAALADGRERFARIETKLDHLPTRGDIEQLQRSIGELGRVHAEIEGVQRTLTTIQETVSMLVTNEIKGRAAS